MTGRVLIWGAGAIGGSVAAYLTRAGHEVLLVDVVPEHVSLIREPSRGLEIVAPDEKFTVAMPACLPEELRGTWQHVLLAVKAQHTAQACKALAPHLAEGGSVVSLQNGLCARVIDQVLGRGTGIVSAINVTGDVLAPGRIRFGGHGTLMIGEADGRMTERLRQYERLLRDFEPRVEITDDIWSFVWSKLGFGLMLVAHALGNASIVECLRRAELLPLWRRLGDEIAQLARAEVVTRHAFDGYDPDAFSTAAPLTATRSSIEAIARFLEKGTKTHSGIWRDLAIHKRPTEVSGQLGPLLQIGLKSGIASPSVARLIEMIGEIESGHRQQLDSNLLELAET